MYVFYPVRSFKLLQAVEVWMVSVTTCIIEICDPVGQELKVPVSLSSGKEYRGAPAAQSGFCAGADGERAGSGRHGYHHHRSALSCSPTCGQEQMCIFLHTLKINMLEQDHFVLGQVESKCLGFPSHHTQPEGSYNTSVENVSYLFPTSSQIGTSQLRRNKPSKSNGSFHAVAAECTILVTAMTLILSWQLRLNHLRSMRTRKRKIS